MTKKINVIDAEIKSKGIGIIVLVENLGEKLEGIASKEFERQKDLGANIIKLCDKSNNIDQEKRQNYIGKYEFNWYTDFYLMKLPCKNAEKLNSELTFEDLTKESIDKFIEVYTKSFDNVPNSATYDREIVLEMLEDEKMKIGFIKYKLEFAGFYELTFEDGEEAELTAVGILPEFRDKSLGKNSIEYINQIFYNKGYKYTKLLVASINEKAFELYKKMGFEIFGERYSRWYHCEL